MHAAQATPSKDGRMAKCRVVANLRILFLFLCLKFKLKGPLVRPSVRIFACCSDDVGVCRLFSDVTCRGMREHHRGGDGDGVMRRGGRVD